MSLSILYRGPLSSCNYGCVYCPFAKHHETDAEHEADDAALQKFLGWSRTYSGRLSIFFTPWGEALVQPRYQQALATLSKQPNVDRVAIQTNLSAGLRFLDDCEVSKLGIWATYHPEWTTRDRFLGRVNELRARNVRFSVGVVGFPRFEDEVKAMRAALPPEIYVWVNAVKEEPYSPELLKTITHIDPLFPLNLKAHPSLGLACRGGHTVISVDGAGDIRTCHFLKSVLGNLYRGDLSTVLKPRPCAAQTCGCHIGYVHLEPLGLEEIFGDGILERVPNGPRAASAYSPTAQ